MCVVLEQNITNIKNKMTDIRRDKEKNLYQNYYNNCDSGKEICTIYGENSVVFWHDDKGIVRGYFYSSDKEELRKLLGKLPQGCVVDYITRTKDKFLDFLSDSGLVLLNEMHRMSSANLTENEKREVERKRQVLKENLYQPKNVRPADLNDLEEIYNKLYEAFDPREGHLPSKPELESYIRNKWVSVYHENKVLRGIEIFKIISNVRYGYLLWNEAGAEGYVSLNVCDNDLYNQYLIENHIESIKQKYSYAWVDAKNKKARRLIEFQGRKFDGLYDFVFEKQ